MPTFMVERYLPGMDCPALRKAIDRAVEEAAAMSAEGVDVRYLGSTFLPDEEACFCRFEACDADAVRQVSERADLAFWRVIRAQFIEPRTRRGT